MFRRVQSQVDWVKCHFFLDRVGESLAETSEHSSIESESIEWGRAAKAMLRVKGALDACRLKPVPYDGYVDGDALCMAGEQSFISKARASPCPRRHTFSFPRAGSISLYRVSTTEHEAEIMANASLGGTSPGALRGGQHHDSHSFMSPRRMAKSGGARRGLLVLVRNLTAAEQADLCAEVRTFFFFRTRQVQKMFFHKKIVFTGRSQDGAREMCHQLSVRTEPCSVKYNAVQCPMRYRVNLKAYRADV